MDQNPKSSDQTQPGKPEPQQHQSSHSSDLAPYPTLDPNDVAPPPPAAGGGETWTSVSFGSQPPPPSTEQPPTNAPRAPAASPPPAAGGDETWTSVSFGSQPPPPSTEQSPTNAPRAPAAPPEGPASISGNSATTMPAESNPYVSPAPVPPSSTKNKMDMVKDVLGKWGKKAADATKKSQDLAGNMWQHYYWTDQSDIKCMAEKDVLGNNRIEDVKWLCSLSESELDLLISLKMLVLQRAKIIGHDALALKFDLKMLRTLGFILMEHFAGRVRDLSVIPRLTEPSAFLDGCNLLKLNVNDDFGSMNIEELKTYLCTDKRKRIAEMFFEDTVPNQKRKTESGGSL